VIIAKAFISATTPERFKWIDKGLRAQAAERQENTARVKVNESLNSLAYNGHRSTLMDIDRQRTLAERISANMLDENRDGRLSAKEAAHSRLRQLVLFFVKATSLSPPSRDEYRAHATATADSVLSDFDRYAKANGRLFPNGIEPVSRTDAEEIAGLERQLVAALRQMPEPDPLSKLRESAFAWYIMTSQNLDVEFHSVMDNLTTPRAPKADRGPHRAAPRVTSRTP
jgi:hypothetical protein